MLSGRVLIGGAIRDAGGIRPSSILNSAPDASGLTDHRHSVKRSAGDGRSPSFQVPAVALDGRRTSRTRLPNGPVDLP